MNVVSMLFVAALAVQSSDPFTGTWRVNLSKADFGQKVEKIVFADGMYTCSTCDPAISVKADGADYAVSGDPAVDTMSVRVEGERNATIVGKKAGKLVFEVKRSVSADGNGTTVAFTSYPQASDKPVTGTART